MVGVDRVELRLRVRFPLSARRARLRERVEPSVHRFVQQGAEKDREGSVRRVHGRVRNSNCLRHVVRVRVRSVQRVAVLASPRAEFRLEQMLVHEPEHVFRVPQSLLSLDFYLERYVAFSRLGLRARVPLSEKVRRSIRVAMSRCLLRRQ